MEGCQISVEVLILEVCLCSELIYSYMHLIKIFHTFLYQINKKMKSLLIY